MAKTTKELRATLPEMFPGKVAEQCTYGALSWATIRDLRRKGKIPAECFKQPGRRILVVRDPFLDWVDAWLEGGAHA